MGTRLIEFINGISNARAKAMRYVVSTDGMASRMEYVPYLGCCSILEKDKERINVNQ